MMKKERCKKIVRFSNNSEVFSRDNQEPGRVFKVRWLIIHLDKHSLKCIELEKDKSIKKHTVKFKCKNLILQHIENKPINDRFSLWLYIYTGRKTTTDFALRKLVVLQLTEENGQQL